MQDDLSLDQSNHSYYNILTQNLESKFPMENFSKKKKKNFQRKIKKIYSNILGCSKCWVINLTCSQQSPTIKQ